MRRAIGRALGVCRTGTKYCPDCGRALDDASTAAAPQPERSDYDLKIDEQAEHFLAAKQQLTYFIVTAAVAPIGIVSTFLKDKGTEVEAWSLSLLLPGSLFGLVAAGAAIFSLHYEHRSHRRHIELRYGHKSFDDLSKADRESWTDLNEWAKRLVNVAFVFVVLEMPLMAAFLTLFVLGVSKQ